MGFNMLNASTVLILIQYLTDHGVPVLGVESGKFVLVQECSNNGVVQRGIVRVPISFRAIRNFLALHKQNA